MANDKSIFQNLNDSLSKVFRHVLPGLFILGFAYLSNPKWFNGFDIKITNHLIVLAVLAIVIGNTWYVVNRYTIIQINDKIMTRKFRQIEKYPIWLSEHIVESNTISDKFRSVKDVMFTKVGQIFYLFIISEAMIILSLFAQCNSDIYSYRFFIITISAILLSFSFWQISLLLHMEQELIKRNQEIN